MLNVKNADMADFEQIMKIYKYAQDYMIKSGNPVQWGHFYPDANTPCLPSLSYITLHTF